MVPRQSSLARLNSRLYSNSGSTRTLQQRRPLIGEVALRASQVGLYHRRRRRARGVGGARKGWCHGQVLRCCTTRTASPSLLTRRHGGRRVLHSAPVGGVQNEGWSRLRGDARGGRAAVFKFCQPCQENEAITEGGRLPNPDSRPARVPRGNVLFSTERRPAV